MKKLFALVLALSLVLCLAACGGDGGKTPNGNEQENTTGDNTQTPSDTQPPDDGPKEVKMTDGRYYLDISGLPCFVRLNEDGTYYATYFGGTVREAGTWEVADKQMDYMTPGPDGDVTQTDDNGTETASQVVIFTSYKTGTPVEVAYANDALCDMSLGGMANHRTLAHEPDYPYNPSVDETAIQLYLFYAHNDIGSNLILNHDKTFEDLTGDAYNSGTWELTGPGSYDLTYDDGSKGTLVTSEDGKSGTLTLADGTAVELRDDYHEPAETLAQVMSLRVDGATVAELPMAVNVRLDGYSDGTCKLIIEVAQIGAELEADTGTFEVSAAMRPTFHFATLGDIEGEPDYAGASESGIPFTVHLEGTVNPEFNGAVSPMTLSCDVTGSYNPNAAPEEAAPTVVTTFRADNAQVGLPMGVGLRLDCYSDSTAVLTVEIAQIGAELEADRGTYKVSATMAFNFSFDKAGAVTGTPDYASATESSIDVAVAYKADVEVEFNGATTPLSIDSALAGTYTVSAE